MVKLIIGPYHRYHVLFLHVSLYQVDVPFLKNHTGKCISENQSFLIYFPIVDTDHLLEIKQCCCMCAVRFKQSIAYIFSSLGVKYDGIYAGEKISGCKCNCFFTLSSSGPEPELASSRRGNPKGVFYFPTFPASYPGSANKPCGDIPVPNSSLLLSRSSYSNTFLSELQRSQKDRAYPNIQSTSRPIACTFVV